MAWTPGQILTAADLTEYLPQAMTTWTSPIAGGITISDGTVVASYTEIGAFMYAQMRLVFGASTAVTGGVTIDLPEDSSLAHIPCMGAVAYDNSATTRYPLVVHGAAATQVGVQAALASGTYVSGAALSSTVPFTWAVNDLLVVQLLYVNA
jgi:hypothetical protein